jgi:hypothetical protein
VVTQDSSFSFSIRNPQFTVVSICALINVQE